MKSKGRFSIISEAILVLTLGLLLLLSQSCSKRPVEPEPELQLQGDPEPEPDPEPESPVKILYAARVYSASLTSEDASWIASHCDLLITDGSSDAWTLELKAENPNLILYRYFSSCTVREPTEKFITSVPLGNLLQEHDNWFWKTAAGDYVRPPKRPQVYLMDPGASVDGWSDYWLEQVFEITSELLYDGIKGDVAAIDVRSIREKAPDIDNRYPTETSFHEVQERHLSALHDGLNGRGKSLILNNVSVRSIIDRYYLPNIRIYNEDGFIQQGYAMKAKEHPDAPFVDSGVHESHMDLVDFCADLEKTIVLAMQPRVNRKDIEYCIGCFLLVRNNPYVYLNIDWDGNYGNMRMLFEQFGDLFETDYGQPLGPRYEENGVWVREFSRGTVVVNLETHTFEFQDNGN